MTEVNVNNAPPVVEHRHVVDDSGDRTGAAGINFLTVVVSLIVVAAILWFLFTGPFRTAFSGASPTNVNVNPPAQQAPPNVNINPPQVNVNPPAQAPSKP